MIASPPGALRIAGSFRMRKDPLPSVLQAIVDKALQKEPKNRYQKISQMRDDLRGDLQEIAGAQLMAGDTYVPSHLDGGVFKRAINWFTGKSIPEQTSTASAFTPSLSNPPSTAPDMTITSTGEKKSVAILPFTNLSGKRVRIFTLVATPL